MGEAVVHGRGYQTAPSVHSVPRTQRVLIVEDERALLRALHDPASGCESAVLAFALLALAAPAAVLLIRHMLIQRGLMKPLSMARDQVGRAAGAGRAGRRTRVG